MGAPADVLIRIDEIEDELHGLSDELHELRALVTRTAARLCRAESPPTLRSPPCSPSPRSHPRP